MTSRSASGSGMPGETSCPSRSTHGTGRCCPANLSQLAVPFRAGTFLQRDHLYGHLALSELRRHLTGGVDRDQTGHAVPAFGDHLYVQRRQTQLNSCHDHTSSGHTSHQAPAGISRVCN